MIPNALLMNPGAQPPGLRLPVANPLDQPAAQAGAAAREHLRVVEMGRRAHRQQHEGMMKRLAALTGRPMKEPALEKVAQEFEGMATRVGALLIEHEWGTRLGKPALAMTSWVPDPVVGIVAGGDPTQDRREEAIHITRHDILACDRRIEFLETSTHLVVGTSFLRLVAERAQRDDVLYTDALSDTIIRMLDVLALADALGIDVDVGDRAEPGRVLPLVDGIVLTAPLMLRELPGESKLSSRVVLKNGHSHRRPPLSVVGHTVDHDGGRISNIQFALRGTGNVDAMPPHERRIAEILATLTGDYDLSQLRRAATAPGASIGNMVLPDELKTDAAELRNLARLIDHRTGTAVMCELKMIQP